MSEHKHEGGHKAPMPDAGSRTRRGSAPQSHRPIEGLDGQPDGTALTFSSGELRASGKNGAQTSVESRRGLYE